MKNVEGKTAFVTGGASGIGLGTSKVFVKNGMKVVIVDMRQSALDEAVAWFKKNGGNVYPLKLNVTDREAYAKAADEVESVFGNIHVLFNNAGIGMGGTTAQTTFKDWDYGMGVNIGGVINGVLTLLPRMLKHGEEGHIVSTSSTCGLLASGGMAIYCASKYAVTGFMECLAIDLEDSNIGVSVLYPGPTRTNLGQSTSENRPEHLRNEGDTGLPQRSGERQRSMEDMQRVFMDPLEMGERVLRGIRRNDLFIHTHPEFTDGYISRHDAIIRAVPEEQVNEERWNLIRGMSHTYTVRYDKQERVGPPDW
ncbi:MAG: SDR family NAD(P)-dependent oxidoreductase [Dehalococcoidales bacterium]|nr:MAG: SDR family NAD(P)-dependent oxidoreductase [Dehalococcoidales bacterium]